MDYRKHINSHPKEYNNVVSPLRFSKNYVLSPNFHHQSIIGKEYSAKIKKNLNKDLAEVTIVLFYWG